MTMKEKSRALVILLSLGFGQACSDEGVTSASKDWRLKQEIWWNDGELLRRAIGSQLTVLRELPPSRGVSDAQWDLALLILTLDRDSDEQTLHTLVDLTSYYLGESGGQVHQCVVLRKGLEIRPFLDAAISSGHNACVGDGFKQICLGPDELDARLKVFVRLITSDVPCEIEP